MKQMTVSFLLRHVPVLEVLLGFKKVGFGSGKYAGIGGKVEPGETLESAAKREVEEEIGVTISDGSIQYMGKVTFLFPYKTEWTQEVSIFLVSKWQGEPKESDEMRPFWFALDRVPYEAMWQDARHWMPLILQGNRIQSTISFRNDNETVHEVCVYPLLPEEANKNELQEMNYELGHFARPLLSRSTCAQRPQSATDLKIPDQ